MDILKTKANIPNTWKVVELGKVGSFIKTNSFSRSQLTDDMIENPIFNIHYGDIHTKFKSDCINMSDVICLSKLLYDEVNDNFEYLKNGDIIIADASEDYQGVCDSVEITGIEESKINLVSGLHTFAFRPNTEFVAKKFGGLILKNEITKKELWRMATGISVLGVNKSNIKKAKIYLPPLPEQKKIAKILSTWDEAIEQNQKLIEQLKLRKKGLMQQLLTGKKRLAGFEGKWKELKAAEIFSNKTDKTHNGDLEVLSATQDKGVIPRSETGIDIKYDKSSLKNYKKVTIGNFVISLRSFQGGIEYSAYEGLVSPAYTVLQEKREINKKFYMEYLKTETFINILNSIIYGIRDGKQISYNEFSSLRILYPPIEEQNAIGNFFDKVDSEIQLQESKLDALKNQKKGLMQKLLTGQIRVSIND